MYDFGPVLQVVGKRLLVAGLNGVYEIRPDGTIRRIARERDLGKVIGLEALRRSAQRAS